MPTTRHLYFALTLDPERFDIAEEFEYKCTPRLRWEVRQIIFAHFDQIVAAWT